MQTSTTLTYASFAKRRAGTRWTPESMCAAADSLLFSGRWPLACLIAYLLTCSPAGQLAAGWLAG